VDIEGDLDMPPVVEVPMEEYTVVEDVIPEDEELEDYEVIREEVIDDTESERRFGKYLYGEDVRGVPKIGIKELDN
jgi:hypothetical protein